MSDSERERRAAAKPIRDAWLRARPFCEVAHVARVEGFDLDACFGALHVHEPWSRAAGGPIDDPRNMASACDHHNTAASQDRRVMRWARTVGLLVRRREGPRWLDRGGRFPSGLTREAALALIGVSIGDT